MSGKMEIKPILDGLHRQNAKDSNITVYFQHA